MATKPTKPRPKSADNTRNRRRIAELQRDYGLGNKVPLIEVRKLSRDSGLDNCARAEACQLLGNVLEDADDFEEAVKAYRRAIELSPRDSLMYRLDLAVCLWIRGVEAAREILQDLKIRKSDTLWKQWWYWLQVLDFHRREGGIDELEKLVKQVPRKVRSDPLIRDEIAFSKAFIRAYR